MSEEDVASFLYAGGHLLKKVTYYDSSGNAFSAALNDPAYAIPAGLISGMAPVNKFGRNTDIDTTEEDVWDGGGIWVAPTQARIHNISSTSTDDDGAPEGTGAHTVRVYGLTDWDTAEVSEDITMNGTSAVATSNSYVIIHRMKVLTKGASGPNVGTISAVAATDATTTAQINPLQGQTQMAIYGIPSTQTAYMTNYYFSALKAVSSGGVDLNLKYNPEPNDELLGFLIKHTQSALYAGSNYIHHYFNPYNSFSGPGILKISAAGSSINNDVSAGFDLILVDN